MLSPKGLILCCVPQLQTNLEKKLQNVVQSTKLQSLSETAKLVQLGKAQG